MRFFTGLPTAKQVRLGCTALGLGTAFLISAPAVSEDGPSGPTPIVRVEEDWQLVLNEPDDGLDSPQFHTVMSPLGNSDSYFAQILWNYGDTPYYREGGLQLQCWNGEELELSKSVGTSQLSTGSETISWTQALTTDGALLAIQIINGASTTWGGFGKDMYISVDALLPFLNDYNTGVSVENSCVTYGSNRVDSLIIKEVRYYGEDGLLYTDENPKVVYELGDDE